MESTLRQPNIRQESTKFTSAWNSPTILWPHNDGTGQVGHLGDGSDHVTLISYFVYHAIKKEHSSGLLI